MNLCTTIKYVIIMKKTLLILCALLLTAVGANAQDYTSSLSSGTWYGNTGVYGNEGAVEHYQTSQLSTGNILFQTITGLPAGTYTVTFYAAASYTSNRGFTAAAGEGIAQVFANEATDTLTVVERADLTEGISAHSYTLSCTVGVDGILEYGIQNIAAGGNWYVAQGVSLTLTAASTATLTSGEVVEDEGDENHLGHWSQTFTNEENTNGALGYNTWSGESGMSVPYHQVHVAIGDESTTVLSDQAISHATMSNLPAGYYTVTVDARVLSEADNAISKQSAYLVANDEKVDLVELAGEDEEFDYGSTEHEVNGSYEIVAEVTETDRTLNISFTISSATYNWLSWKNLKVVYIGTSIEYEIGEPECSAKVVRPGDEVSITFNDCITPNPGDEEPTLDTSKTITVGTTTVAVTNDDLDCKGYSATVTFTIPDDITVGEDVSIEVPAGLIYWDVTEGDNVLSPEATFTLHTPATIADGDYLIMNEDGYYLGGGLAWGTEATLLGKPQFIGFEVQTNGTYHLDSHQYNGADAHYLGANLYFDNGTPVDWTLVKVDGGYALFEADVNHYVTGNGFQEVVTLSDEPTVWTLLTMEDVVASMDAATEDAPVDVTALIKAPELKRNSSTDYYTTWTITGYDGTGTPNNYSFGGSNDPSSVANCAESYHSTNGFNFSQEITLPLAGTYTLSAKGFYRDDSSETLLLPVMYAGDQTSTFPELDTSANTMAEAYAEFLEGLHQIDTITITTYSSGGTVTIGFKGEDTSLWQIMGELDLQYLGVVEETVTWEMTTANWATLILPFDVAADDVPEDLTIYTCTGTETDEETDTTTVVVTEVTTGIAANTPYLVKGNVEQDTDYEFTGTPVEAEGALTKGLLTGTYETMYYDDLSALESNGSTVYLLQNHTTEEGGNYGVGFYPVVTSSSSDASLTPYHCYLTIEGDASVSPTRLSIGHAGEETGIVAVEGTEVADDAIYDLSGRRVAKAVKGVYIQNGKKVLVK